MSLISHLLDGNNPTQSEEPYKLHTNILKITNIRYKNGIALKKLIISAQLKRNVT